MPNFAPTLTSCTSQEVGRQYGLAPDNSSPNIVTDEFKSSASSTLLW